MFGETEIQRYERYLKVKKFHEENPDEDMKLYDEEYHQKLKENEWYEELDARFRSRLIEPKLLADPVFRKRKLEMIKGEKNRDFPDICDEVYLWITKVLRDWGS